VEEHVVAQFGTPPVQPLDRPAKAKEAAPSLEASVDLSKQTPAVSSQAWKVWLAIAGDSVWDQIKAVLAGVGVLAILIQGLRLTARSSPPAEAPAASDDD
jgi:hypothetical protein